MNSRNSLASQRAYVPLYSSELYLSLTILRPRQVSRSRIAPRLSPSFTGMRISTTRTMVSRSTPSVTRSLGGGLRSVPLMQNRRSALGDRLESPVLWSYFRGGVRGFAPGRPVSGLTVSTSLRMLIGSSWKPSTTSRILLRPLPPRHARGPEETMSREVRSDSGLGKLSWEPMFYRMKAI